MWGLAVVLVGLLYGWMTPGRQETGRLLWNGLLMGLVLALVLALLGGALDSRPLGFGADIGGVVLTVLVLTVVFVIGAWLGDRIEGAVHRDRRVA